MLALRLGSARQQPTSDHRSSCCHRNLCSRGNYSAERAERETGSDCCHSSSNASNLTATFLLQFRSHFAQLRFDSFPERFYNFFLAYPHFLFAHFDQNPLDGKTIADERISFFMPYS